MKLRPYQAEDLPAVIEAHKAYRGVLCRWATGLGKGVLIAALAQHYSQFGRVMILVDVEKLVWQLSGAVRKLTGIAPGIEMGDLRANNLTGGWTEPDQIIVGTVQSQYAGGEGRERFRRFDPAEFALIVLDECESFLADRYGQPVAHYLTNPACRLFACSATPFRTDGKGMGRLCEYANNEPGPLNRDILWGIDAGYLVPARQGFVRVSLDFSTLAVRKGEDGEADTSAEQVERLICEERPLIELAQGIIHEAGDRRSLIVCPKVESAKAVAHYLDGERRGSARCIYGEMSDQEKADVFAAHQRGEFQFLSSVMMLCKGYDDPSASAVFNCRKTRSKRLFQQIAGRVVRVLPDIVEGVDEAGLRRAAIKASGKPDALVVNMVGLDDSVRDITLVDLLSDQVAENVRERAKRKMLEPDGEADPEKAIEAAAAEIDAEEDRARKARRLVQVKANVEAEYTDGWQRGGGTFGGDRQAARRINAGIEAKHERQLVRFRVPESDIRHMTPEIAASLSGRLTARHKAGLATFRQCKQLIKHGYTKEQTRPMTKRTAGEILDSIAAVEGWGSRGETAGVQP